mmetsp:Transcript_95702/g.117284  ORF Transcript_95702/g.117284 Transcript_95702/m.117284 type:complete len:102 (+) Transcript_95702:63-368(+)
MEEIQEKYDKHGVTSTFSIGAMPKFVNSDDDDSKNTDELKDWCNEHKISHIIFAILVGIGIKHTNDFKDHQYKDLIETLQHNHVPKNLIKKFSKRIQRYYK